ncbi:hypothetical protein [Spirobacillus cienkowskii]|jgi:hypothetical protein|uniref:Proteinase inhibitor I42 chagasin domain-containing protein n=1 Tax=Spirobacillus cienkowskii TaxID=495820 RepID=A0A369KZU2_9BACT|nr:MAG: hypothetical protein DCC88_00735 [Spirobacillus cienkowskii]
MIKTVKLLGIFYAIGSFMVGCSTSSRSIEENNNLPSQNEIQGYKIISGLNKDSVSIEVDKDDKIAVVLKDITTTSYNYLEPRFSGSMVKFDGKNKCCMPKGVALGNSGNVVYKFSFIGEGKTTITIVARQKSESPTAKSLENDKTFTINVDID